MSSLDRMLNLLNAFRADAPTCSTEELMRFAGTSRATGYRYLVALQRAGLISATADGRYMLGPRIAELDRQVRQSDPLYCAAGPIMRELTRHTGHSALLCMLYADRVLCLRDERSEDSPADLFNRGQSRPLFTAAASKVILANLAPHELRRLYDNNAAGIAHAGLGGDWAAFRLALRAIRAAGVCVTTGEFRPGVAGVSAPVFSGKGRILGSIGLAMAARHVTEQTLPELSRRTRDAAATLSAAMQDDDVAAGHPRGVGSIPLAEQQAPNRAEQEETT